MLIASLPPVHQNDLLKEIITHPCVETVRYNTGMSSAYDPLETVRRIKEYSVPAGKPVFIDLKAKQLRVIEWANLPEGPIVLNHKIKVKMPAKVYFRGDDCCGLKEVVDGTNIFVDPLPKAPVGRGQSVNIVAAGLEIEGGLLPLDHAYIKAALEEGIYNFMLSFVEGFDDIRELEGALGKHAPKSKICLKIESRDGVDFIRKTSAAALRPYRLMAARDDLMIQIGIFNMRDALKVIIRKDPKAICASRLLLGLETGGVSMADVSDIEYMRTLGYRDFMLSDGISRLHFTGAVKFWQDYEKSRSGK